MTVPKILFILFILMTVKTVQATSWNIDGLKVSSDNLSLKIKIEELSISQIDEKIKGIEYKCFSSYKLYPIHKCNKGNISFVYLKNQYNFQFNGWFDFVTNKWDVTLINHSNNMTIQHSSENQDKVTIKIQQMPVAEFSDLIKDQITINKELIEGLMTADIEMDFSGLFSIVGSYQLENFNWESESSEYVLAETKILGEFMLRPYVGGYELLNSTSIEAGEGLFKDIYLVFEKDMFVVNSVVDINNDFAVTNLELNFELTESNHINIDVFDLDNLDMDIDFSISELYVLYNKYLKSYFEIIGISEAEIDGEINGKISLKGGEVESIKADIFDVYMEIDSKKVEVNNLNSSINWHNQGELMPSSFKWDALLLAGMPINQSQLKVMSAGQELRIEDDTHIPIFDGSLDITKLTLKDIFQPEISIQFDGEVQPISLALITEKMGWPVMNGYISGKIPGMQKLGNSITFDGQLELSVFDGTMQIEDLSIERLFGIAPVIAADIKFKDLSLLQITSTYDFGDITGNINGYINNMRITNWQADRLDAYVESVKVKGVKQLISQRAIDNISSIGGVQGALSRSFLKFFDAFRYKKIGIGCKLRNSICEMKGLKTTKTNYQIVEGKGLPSINIFGYRKFIDWQVFLDRLLNASF